MREAIVEELGEVEFVDMGEADGLVGEDSLVDGGDGVLISVASAEELAAGVVGIDVGAPRSGAEFHGQTVQFMWTGETWADATSEDTGVTVTRRCPDLSP